MCCILGVDFEKCADYNEAAMWYYNARYETEPLLNIRSKGEIPLKGLIRIMSLLGQDEMVKLYTNELESL